MPDTTEPKTESQRGSNLSRFAGAMSTATPGSAPAAGAETATDGSGEAQAKPGTGEGITLKVGNADRVFTREELQAAIAELQSLDQRKAAADEALASLATRSALLKQFESLTPEQSASVQRLFEHPEQVEALLTAGSGEQKADDDEFDVSRFLGESNKSQTAEASRALAGELGQMKQALNALAARENVRIQDEREQTFRQEIARHMAGFTVFDGDAPRAAQARKMAERDVMLQIAASGGRGIDVRMAVAKAAGDLQEYLNASDAHEGPPVRRDQSDYARRPDSLGNIALPNRPPTGDEMFGRPGAALRIIQKGLHLARQTGSGG